MDYTNFPTFYNNPSIQKIAKNAKWTVSGQIGKSNKAPLDIAEYKNGHIWGASMNKDYNPLVTLNELCELLPTAQNNTYYLDAVTDGIVVLDIEPKCPEHIKKSLLQLPYTYGETSMSGKGYHLIFDLPYDILAKYPAAQTKLALKIDTGYYEILMQHFVTFTRNTLKPPSTQGYISQFNNLFESLCAEQKQSVTAAVEFDITDQEPDIPYKDKIVKQLQTQRYKKDLDAFNGDNSRYEFGYIGFLLYKLKAILEVSYIKSNNTYTDEQKAWLLYLAIKDMIEARPKHEQTRNGLPWLLWLASDIVAKDSLSQIDDTIESK